MTKLKLLLVEDNDTDALLVVRQLRKEGFDVEHIQVKNRFDMEQALDKGGWDIVISDYSLPGFGGKDALDIFKSRDLDIPFILVSGTVGEDIAVSIMKGGANDYLMKTHLNRLGPAVKRELEETAMKREKMRIESMLSKTESRFRRLIQDLIDVVWLSDETGKKLYIINAAFEKIFGIVPEEVKNEPARWEALVADDDLAIFRKFTAGLFQKGIDALEYRIVRSDGNQKWIYDQRYVVQDGNNGEIMVGGILSDITDKKIADQELLAAKRSAEESSRLKSALLQNMSHEFRTPMNGILGFSEILLGQIADPECSLMIRHIATSGQRLQRTLDAIMFFAQLEGGIVIKNSFFDAGEIIGKVSQEFSGMAKQKGLSFNVEIHQPLFLKTDQKLFEISVRNITENAIKFTEKGRVEITGNIQGNNPPNIVINVSDTGIGIAREKHGLVFEEFRQANEGYARPYEGSGLGLSIAKKCITLLNGTLQLQSEPGSGTIVTITLPVNGSVHDVTPDRNILHINESSPKIAKNEGQRILLVEDNDSNIDLVRVYVNRVFDLDIAKDSSSAINLVQNNQYDAILMDINLGPGPDGIDTIAGIRKIEGYQSTPIIAVTGYTFRNEKEFITSQGADHYLGKPFDKRTLLSTLERAIIKKDGD